MKYKKLGEECYIVMGQSPESKTYNSKREGIPFLQGRKTFGRIYPYIDTWTTHPIRIGKKDSVLFSVRAPVGDVNIATEEICIGRGLASISMKNKHNLYLYYLLLDNRENIKNMSTGTVFESINRSELENLVLKFHEEKEQYKIEKLLGNIDKKIELNNQINDNLYEMLKWLYKELYLSSDDYNIWDDMTLNDITSKFATGLNPRKNFVLGQGNNYYVTIKNMPNNKVILDDKCDKVDDDALVKINKRSDLKVGDLLFSGIGTIGRTYLIKSEPTNWNISESIFTIRPNEKISSEFLYLLLLDNDMQNYAVSKASGSVQKGIRMSDLKSYKLKVPDKKWMDDFTNKVSPLINKIYSNINENETLSQLRDTLLPKLMNDEIDLENIEI